MTRRRLIDSQSAHAIRHAEELVTGASPPKQRGAASKARATHRVGTLSTPYKRADGVRTVKLNVTLDTEVVAMLKQYTLRFESEGLRRAEWIEAALEHCIRTGFRPPRHVEQQRRAAAELQSSNAAEPQSREAAEEET